MRSVRIRGPRGGRGAARRDTRGDPGRRPGRRRLGAGGPRLEPERPGGRRHGGLSHPLSPRSSWRWSTARSTTRWSRSRAGTSRTSASWRRTPPRPRWPLPRPRHMTSWRTCSRSRRPISRRKLDTSLEAVPDGPAKDAGVAVGQAAAAQMIAAREGDGRGGDSPARPTVTDRASTVRRHRTSRSSAPPWIADVKPFLAEDIASYRTDGPYALDSAEYAAEFNEVKDARRARGLDPHARAGRARGVLGHAPRAVVRRSSGRSRPRRASTSSRPPGCSGSRVSRWAMRSSPPSTTSTTGCSGDP